MGGYTISGTDIAVSHVVSIRLETAYDNHFSLPLLSGRISLLPWRYVVMTHSTSVAKRLVRTVWVVEFAIVDEAVHFFLFCECCLSPVTAQT